MIKNIEPTFQLNQKLSLKKKEQKEPYIYELTNKRKNERGINVDYQTIWKQKKKQLYITKIAMDCTPHSKTLIHNEM